MTLMLLSVLVLLKCVTCGVSFVPQVASLINMFKTFSTTLSLKSMRRQKRPSQPSAFSRPQTTTRKKRWSRSTVDWSRNWSHIKWKVRVGWDISGNYSGWKMPCVLDFCAVTLCRYTLAQVFAARDKYHQAIMFLAAVKFMWDTCCESLSRMKDDPGGGCILAHCMGLGKTLSVRNNQWSRENGNSVWMACRMITKRIFDLIWAALLPDVLSDGWASRDLNAENMTARRETLLCAHLGDTSKKTANLNCVNQLSIPETSGFTLGSFLAAVDHPCAHVDAARRRHGRAHVHGDLPPQHGAQLAAWVGLVEPVRRRRRGVRCEFHQIPSRRKEERRWCLGLAQRTTPSSVRGRAAVCQWFTFAWKCRCTKWQLQSRLMSARSPWRSGTKMAVCS